MAALIAALVRRSKESATATSPRQEHSGPTVQLTVGGNMAEAVVGSSGVSVDRRQYNLTITPPDNPRRPAALALVDVLTVYREEHSVLDIKVRNSSDEIVLLKRAEIEVLGEWNIPRPDFSPYAVEVSWVYDADVTRGSAIVSLSQAIKPNDVDRFEIRIGSNSREGKYPFRGLFLYLLRVVLRYNENDLSLECPPILLHIPCPMEIQAMSTGPPSDDRLAKNKSSAAGALAAIGPATIVDQKILDAIRSWAE